MSCVSTKTVIPLGEIECFEASRVFSVGMLTHFLPVFTYIYAKYFPKQEKLPFLLL